MGMDERPVIILGGGGHAAVVADTLRNCGEKIAGFTAPEEPKIDTIHGVGYLGDDAAVLSNGPAGARLALGMGSVRPDDKRNTVYGKFKAAGFDFVTVIHPAAVVAPDVRAGEGCQIMAGAIVQTLAQIGTGTIVNTGAMVDHHCRIGDFVHIAPGATLSGGISVGDGAMIGAGATVIQNVVIGTSAFVTAGVTVLEDVPDGVRTGSKTP